LSDEQQQQKWRQCLATKRGMHIDNWVVLQGMKLSNVILIANVVYLIYFSFKEKVNSPKLKTIVIFKVLVALYSKAIPVHISCITHKIKQLLKKSIGKCIMEYVIYKPLCQVQSS
jgi:hypothetical protein